MGTFSFLVLIAGFIAVIYWYFLNAHYGDNNGSTSFLGVKNDLDDEQQAAMRALFSLKTGKLLYQNNKPNEDRLDRHNEDNTSQDNYDRNEANRKKLEEERKKAELDKEEEEQENREEDEKKKRNSRFYRYTDDSKESRYKIIPRRKDTKDQQDKDKDKGKGKL